MNVTKQPTVHLSSFLKKHINKEDLATKGNALTQLVHGKAKEIMAACEGILDSSELQAALEKGLPARDRSLGSFTQVLCRLAVLLPFPFTPLLARTLSGHCRTQTGSPACGLSGLHRARPL